MTTLVKPVHAPAAEEHDQTPPAECGTPAGYVAHGTWGHKPCPTCTNAWYDFILNRRHR